MQTNQISQMMNSIMPMMVMMMTMGTVRPVMLQLQQGAGKKTVYNPIVQESRIYELRTSRKSEYTEVIPTQKDDENCRECGYPKGARAKFINKKTGTIHTFCNLETLVK